MSVLLGDVFGAVVCGLLAFASVRWVMWIFGRLAVRVPYGVPLPRYPADGFLLDGDRPLASEVEPVAADGGAGVRADVAGAGSSKSPLLADSEWEF